jgi:hypothetical protein
MFVVYGLWFVVAPRLGAPDIRQQYKFFCS